MAPHASRITRKRKRAPVNARHPYIDFSTKKSRTFPAPFSATLSAVMPDDDEKPAPIPFIGDVTVDRTRVQVMLLLKLGTAVSVAETKTTTEPEPSDRRTNNG
jgi:hypothetical protein